METLGLQGSNGPEETFLHCGVGKAYEVNSYTSADFNLDGNRDGFYADAFSSMNINQHSQFFCRKAGEYFWN